jgi:hypothetical protein
MSHLMSLKSTQGHTSGHPPACLSLFPPLLLLRGSLLSPGTLSALEGSTKAGQRVKPQLIPSVLMTFSTKSMASVLLRAIWRQ